MKEDRSDLTNIEISDYHDEDFEAVFASCKQDVSQFEEEEARLRKEHEMAMRAQAEAEAEAEVTKTTENIEEAEAITESEETESEVEVSAGTAAEAVQKESCLRCFWRKQPMNVKEKEKRKPDSEKNRKKEIYDWMQTIVMAMVVCIVVFTFFVRIVGVVGSSMVPTLQNGDKLIVSNVNYTPQRGDIVILRKDAFMKEPIVKRIIALEGQEVDINFDRGILYVDGLAQQEPYINDLTLDEQDFDGPITVPENCVFVLGDNRNHSTDSRTASLGCVDVRYIIGKVYWVVYPGTDQIGERSFNRIGSPYAK